jgi:hypothetical protein
MDIQSGDISKLVFKRTARNDSGKISIDHGALEVLFEINGKASLGAIAQKTGLDMANMRSVVSKLVEQKLIVPITNGVKVLGSDFLQALEDELAVAVGPIADVLVEDAFGDMGLPMGQVPFKKAAELVELLSRDIQKEGKKAAFIKNMIGIIRNFQS